MADSITPHSAPLKFLTDSRLWDALFPHLTNTLASRRGKASRMTKAEAFYDLVNRHKMYMITRDDDVINASVQSLAEHWGWNRPTAKKFLDDLAETGAISLRQLGNRIVVRLNNIVEDT